MVRRIFPGGGMRQFLAGGGDSSHLPNRENPGGRGEGLDQNIYGGSYEPSRDEPSRGITVVV